MPRKPSRPTIPTFSLYGEAGGSNPDLLHIEPIQSRSRRHQWEIAAHTHHGLFQIVHVDSGPADIAVDEARASLAGPVAIVVPPGAVHAFSFSGETDGHVLTFRARAVIEGDLPATGQALRDLFAAPRILRLDPGDDPVRVAALMNTLAGEFAAPGGAASPAVQWLARALVWRLANAVPDPGAQLGDRPRGRALYTRFVVLLEAHHRDHWSVAQYADRLGMTPERLNRLTRSETGRGALDLIQDRLVREAGRRLTYVAAPIGELARELGFADPAYFCRFFKRRTGRTPREHRQSTAKPV